MNAASNSRDEFISDNAGDSDSDTNSDENLDYYQPISSINAGEDSDANNFTDNTDNGYYDHQSQSRTVDQLTTLSNGHDQLIASATENGVRSLNLSSEDEEERENEEEEARRRAEMDRAMWRAFQEDESRRNAPLSSDNATRVMEAMRRVSCYESVLG